MLACKCKRRIRLRRSPHRRVTCKCGVIWYWSDQAADYMSVTPAPTPAPAQRQVMYSVPISLAYSPSPNNWDLIAINYYRLMTHAQNR